MHAVDYRGGSRLFKGGENEITLQGRHTTVCKAHWHTNLGGLRACYPKEFLKIRPLRWTLRVISVWVHHNFYMTAVFEVTALLGYLDLDTYGKLLTNKLVATVQLNICHPRNL